jgi:hypothetical protein
MRRLIFVSFVAGLVAAGSGLTVAAQSPSPSPPSAMSIEADVAFPSTVEVGDALATEVEVLGIQENVGQLWEGVELDPTAVTAAQMRFYRWVPSGIEDAPTSAVVEIVRFRSTDEAAIHRSTLAESITGPLQGFETDLSADLVATGSWASSEGFGGSTILVQEGPVVAIVTAVRSGAEEMEHTSTIMAALVIERLSGDE